MPMRDGFIERRVGFDSGTGRIAPDQSTRKEYFENLNSEILRNELDVQKDKVTKLVMAVRKFVKANPTVDTSELVQTVLEVQRDPAQPQSSSR